MPLAMIRAALASVARLAIIPVQDLLALPTEARFNIPGTLEGNWCWRLDSLDSLVEIKDKFQALNRLYRR
jgi:4-alpha-glucanotransferase